MKTSMPLVSNAVSESRTFDYKESLPGNSDGEKYGMSLRQSFSGKLLMRSGRPRALIEIQAMI
jgi:hypothetical protein